jgi:glycine oxidase
MQDNIHVDNLIVGAGLAGVWTAFHLMQQNKSFALVDVPSQNHSSRIAAGIYNPLLAKHQKRSYNADKLYPGLSEKYHEMEHYVHEKFCHKHPILYIIESLKEMNDWAALAEEEWFADYVMLYNERISDHIVSDFGHIEIQESGWVDIPKMLDAFLHHVKSPNVYQELKFDASKLEIQEKGFTYQNINAEHIIFCQGVGMLDNPFTKDIPLKPAKGEILHIEANDAIEACIPQHGVFMLPIDENIFRVGSNFSWDELTDTTTLEAKEEIVAKFTKWYKGPFEITKQVAGIRPSSLDRRPILGRLKFHPNAFILNGFGSKGVALAPYYSKMLTLFMYNEGLIDNEVDVNRIK